MILDNILNSSTRHANGFRGYMSLLAEDRENAVILTLWQDEESLSASEKGVFAEAKQKVTDFLKKPPVTRKFRVYSTELFQRIETKGVI